MYIYDINSLRVSQLLYCVLLKIYNKFANYFCELKYSGNHKVLSPVKSDLLAVEQRKEFTSTSELKQIELFVQILEVKLHEFYQILPRPGPRRGLLNLGGNILKTIFGTATVSDIHELHGVLDLQNRNSDIVYSLANQLTYVKK